MKIRRSIFNPEGSLVSDVSGKPERFPKIIQAFARKPEIRSINVELGDGTELFYEKSPTSLFDRL